jgi:hypothetical protein
MIVDERFSSCDIREKPAKRKVKSSENFELVECSKINSLIPY